MRRGLGDFLKLLGERYGGCLIVVRGRGKVVKYLGLVQLASAMKDEIIYREFGSCCN